MTTGGVSAQYGAKRYTDGYIALFEFNNRFYNRFYNCFLTFHLREPPVASPNALVPLPLAVCVLEVVVGLFL